MIDDKIVFLIKTINSSQVAYKRREVKMFSIEVNVNIHVK